MASFSTTALGPESPLFRGRQAELARLLQLCRGEVTSYVVLYGGRQNGKTSLLLRLEVALRADTAVCRLDFQLVKGATADRAFAFLAEQIAQALPLASDPGSVGDGPALRRFLSQALARPELTRFVLILDEWGALSAETREVLANALRSLFDARLTLPVLTKLQVVFSGGVELYDMVVAEASSLHSVCEEVYLTDLVEDEAVALVADGLRGLGLGEREAVDLGAAVYARVAGHPYLTQRLSGLLERAHHDGQALAPTVVDEATRQVLQGDSLLRRIRDDLHEHRLEDAMRRLLRNPPCFTRLDDDMARLELIGLAMPAGERWAPRNPLLAEVFGERLGVDVPAPVAPQPVAPAPQPVAPAPQPVAPAPQPVAPAPQPVAPSSLPPWVPVLVKVPAGPFLMGGTASDGLAYDHERPQHTLTLPDYWIGRTPVTNAQFRPFVEGDGYRNWAYWTTVGWQWRKQNRIVRPSYWADAKWNGDDYPVVGVSWFEAVAYVRWLSAQTGHAFRLPNEAEWEKAARGPDGLIWPWGNVWEKGRCNSSEHWVRQQATGGRVAETIRQWLSSTGLKVERTTPVDQFSGGASPYGVLDMVGNAWEWCTMQHGKSHSDKLDDEWAEAYLEVDTERPLRGGSCYSDQKYVRVVYHLKSNPRYRHYLQGLRVASRAPLTGSAS